MLYIKAIVIKKEQILCWRKESAPSQFVQNDRHVAKRCGPNVLHRISLCELLSSYPECSLLHVPVKVQ